MAKIQKFCKPRALPSAETKAKIGAGQRAYRKRVKIALLTVAEIAAAPRGLNAFVERHRS